ncbi:MAG: hypothetical protein PUC33_01870 [Oscillospiraceae bacterium]|nr:hypothetical protein [Oscillospiraceae bacterium]
MKKKIIVAGLGHGGIAAAALLAGQGFDVTVYEKKKEGTLGYDWTDIFAPQALTEAGIPMPDESKYEYKENMTFYSPSQSKGLKQEVEAGKREIKMERRAIYEHLIRHAVACGVKIEYECEVLAPITLGSRVVGIKTAKGDFLGDLVIDACGMRSPVRCNLPDSFGIEKEVSRKDRITIFRAFFNKNPDAEVEANYKVMLFPSGEKCISWVAAEEQYADLLIGRFKDYDSKGVEDFADMIRRTNPVLGHEILRGGQMVEIPVRRTLSVLVADGYAAIGDSAFMTVPLIGSGIANCLKAARMLSDAVAKDRNGEFSAATLWEYQKAYYKKLGNSYATLAMGKDMLFCLDPEDIDYIFESGMVTGNDLTMDSDFAGLSDMLKFDPKDLLNKAQCVLQRKQIIKKCAPWVVKIGKAAAVCAAMPKEYNKKKVLAWARAYDSLYE